MRKLLIGGLLAALIVASVIIAGPFLFYGAVVPHLSPILPRSEGVPDHARASYHWKGFGMTWRWEDKIDGACGQWMAAETRGEPVRIFHLFEGRDGCDGERVVRRYSFHGRNIIGDHEAHRGGQPCPFTVSAVDLETYAGYVSEIRVLQRGELERELLNDVERRLLNTDGETMVTDQGGGCADEPFRKVKET